MSVREQGEAARTSAGSLAPGDILRQGSGRDDLALTWLIRTSTWSYTYGPLSPLREILEQELSYLWLHGKTLRAALLLSCYRLPVATVRVLAWRRAGDSAPFFGLILPAIEHALSNQGARWISLSDPPAWLQERLEASGFHLETRVVFYHLPDLNVDMQGHFVGRIRGADEEDLAAILTLDAAAFEPFWRLSEEFLYQALTGSHYALVAELEGEVVGYLLAERWEQEGYISRVAVTPDLQGRSIGRQLMAAALVLLKSHGLKGIWLNTQEDNLRSRRLYEHLGFRLTERTETFWAKSLSLVCDTDAFRIETE